MYNFVRGSRRAFKWNGLRGLITRVKKVFQHKAYIVGFNTWGVGLMVGNLCCLNDIFIV